MCKSLADGGQRCASHTRERLSRAAAKVEAVAQDRAAVLAARDEWVSAAAEYASTNEGRAHFIAQREVAEATGHVETAAMLNTVVAKGDAMRAANKDAAALVYAVRLTQTEPGTTSVPDVPTPAPTAPVCAAAPDLSPTDRERWDAMVADMHEFLPMVERLSRFTPEQLTEAVEGLDRVAGDPTSTDTDLAAAIEAFDKIINSQYPPLFTRTDPGSAAKGETVWRRFATRRVQNREIQHLRILNHPHAGHSTYRTLFKDHPRLRATITANHACPAEILSDAVRATPDFGSPAPQSVHPSAWERARTERFTNPSLALSLATKDHDSFQRAEAVNQVLMTPMESFTEEDRHYMAEHIAEVPGRSNQTILAQSLAAYAASFSDDAERRRLAQALIGAAGPTTHGEPNEEILRIGQSLDLAPATRRGWLR